MRKSKDVTIGPVFAALPASGPRAGSPPPAPAATDTVDIHYFDAERDQRERDKYYAKAGSLEKKTPFAMIQSLRKLVTQTHTSTLGYIPSKYLRSVDLRPDGQQHSIYGTRLEEQARRCGLDPVQMGLNLAAASVEEFNCEHAVPRVWFGDEHTQRGDLHHLFSSDPRLNSLRGSMKLGEGPGYFDPQEGKGALARATFYCLLRYPSCAGDYSKAELEVLKRWSREEPVSVYEKHRNLEISHMQGNRNPFIDFPALADKVSLGF